MMKLSVTSLLVLLIFLPGIGHCLNDTVKNGDMREIDSLNNLAKMMRFSNPDRYKEHAEKTLKLAQKNHYLAGEAVALRHLASYYYITEQHQKTYECINKIIEICKQIKDTLKLADHGYIYFAEFFTSIKDTATARKYLDLATRLVSHSRFISLKSHVFSASAIFLLAKKEYDSALTYFYLSYYYAYKAGERSYQARAFKFIGDIYGIKGRTSLAIHYYLKSGELYRLAGEFSEQAIVFTRIAHDYQDLGYYQAAFEYDIKSLAIRKEMGQRAFIASAYYNVGKAFYMLGRKDSASIYFNKALLEAGRIRNNYLLEAINRQLYEQATREKSWAKALNYYKASAEAKRVFLNEQAKTEIGIREANRSILAEQSKIEFLNKEIEIQKLQLKNRKIQIVVYELTFVSMMFLFLFILLFIKRHRTQKHELIVMNNRLLQEIVERKETLNRLKQSEELHRFLAENTIDVISMLDANLQRKYISPSCLKVFGYTPEETYRFDGPLDLVHPSSRILVNQHLLELLRNKEPVRYTYLALRKDGSTFWAEASVNPVLNPGTGKIRELISVIRDISDIKKHEDELSENAHQKELLLHEIHNRVKNNFSILISLMNMQREKSSDQVLGESLTELQLRIRTMSLVHEHLYNTQQISVVSFDDYLLRLAFIIAASYNNDRVRMQTEIHNCVVPIEIALPLGLIVNELMTNVYKYAFPGNMTGEVQIKLIPEEGSLFCLTVSDDGVGLPAEFSLQDSVSMGSQIISLLTEQIEATIEVSTGTHTSFSIHFSATRDK